MLVMHSAIMRITGYMTQKSKFQPLYVASTLTILHINFHVIMSSITVNVLLVFLCNLIDYLAMCVTQAAISV